MRLSLYHNNILIPTKKYLSPSQNHFKCAVQLCARFWQCISNTIHEALALMKLTLIADKLCNA